MTPLRIATRGSPLALWQANFIADRLRQHAARDVELVIVQTAGDVFRDAALARIGGEGLFTKEVQKAVLDGAADLAVHSLKDLPTVAAPGLTLAAVPPRGPTGDAFVSLKHARFDALPQGAVVATSSLRRRAQVLNRRPDLTVVDIRGNVETRLRKLEEQDLDATLLAQAGLERLGLADRITELLDPSWMLPAVGQGALGIECREDDAATLTSLSPLDDAATRQAVLAERSFLRAMGGGCQVPMGAAAVVTGDLLSLHVAVLLLDGARRLESHQTGPADEAEEIGKRAAEALRTPPPAPPRSGEG